MQFYNVGKFQDFITKLSETVEFSLLARQAQKRYEIKSLKTGLIGLSKGIRLYKSVVERAQKRLKKDLQPQIQWFENERKIFVWFLILYCYDARKITAQLTQEETRFIASVFSWKSFQLIEYEQYLLPKHISGRYWTKEQDQLLINCINLYGDKKWTKISQKIFAISNKNFLRQPKSCRQRWFNHLDPKMDKSHWTEQQDRILYQNIEKNGFKWSKLVPLLNHRRTEHMIKNRYYCLQRKKTTHFSKSSSEQKEITSNYFIKQQQIENSVIKQQFSNVILPEQNIQKEKQTQKPSLYVANQDPLIKLEQTQVPVYYPLQFAQINKLIIQNFWSTLLCLSHQNFN